MAKKKSKAKKGVKKTLKSKVAKKTKSQSRKLTAKSKVKAGRKIAKKKTSSTEARVSKKVSIPKIGDLAPTFSLPATNGGNVSLTDLRGRVVVLYFYPKDDTPGCTVEACSFRDEFGQFHQLGAEIIGVSPDDVTSHSRFAQKYSLPFTLLADAAKKTVKEYGVWVEKNMYGKKHLGVQRATFVIDRDGKIAAAWPKVTVEGHSQEVLDAIKNL